jgi:serine/threonine protein kinase
MKPYTMDGLKIMKILDDFKTNGIVTDDEYWNVIAFLTQRLLLGIKSIHTHGYTHNDLKPGAFGSAQYEVIVC